MVHFTVISNNPMLYERIKPLQKHIQWVDSSVQEVLSAARKAIKKGAVLLSSPMGGMQTGLVNPYKSIIVSAPQANVDFNSIKMIDESIAAYSKNAKLRHLPYNDNMVKDFQLLDMEMLAMALAAMPREGV
jgi:hypothetical protein